MLQLKTRIFIGATVDEATALLTAAIDDGSYPVPIAAGLPPVFAITHRPEVASYELHVTAWTEVP